MNTLIEDIERDIQEAADTARANLAALIESANQAEQLANRLCSAGVPARASGRADGVWILIWVTVGPIDPHRLEAVLTRLDLRVTSTQPGFTDYEMRLEGYAVPLYVMAKPNQPSTP